MRTFRTVLITIGMMAFGITWLVIEMLAVAKRIEQEEM